LRRGEVGEGRRRLTAEQERRFTRLLARGVHYAGIEPRIADFLH